MVIVIKACTRAQGKWYTVTSAEQECSEPTPQVIGQTSKFVLQKAKEQGLDPLQLKLIIEFLHKGLVS